MVFNTSSCLKPAKTLKSQKNLQCSSKISRRCPKQEILIWTTLAARSDRNYFSLHYFSADIEEMLLQVAVAKDDNRCLQILLREDPESKIEVYEYTRHLFGQRVCPLVQTTLCTKWRKIMQSATNASSERLSATFTWMAS